MMKLFHKFWEDSIDVDVDSNAKVHINETIFYCICLVSKQAQHYGCE